MFKINNKDTKTTPLVGQWHRFDVFIGNFEYVSHLCSSVSIVNFEQVNASLLDRIALFLMVDQQTSKISEGLNFMHRV